MGQGHDKVEEARKHAELVSLSRKLARVVQHEDPPAKACRARRRLEKDLAKWLRHYGGEAFSDPWSPVHLVAIRKIAKALKEGGTFAFAFPRGYGKTTIVKWAVVFALLTGLRKYVMQIAATEEMAEELVEFVLTQLSENERLHEHYPHVTAYFRAADGKAIKARYQLRRDLLSTGLHFSSKRITLPTVPGRDAPYPSDGGTLEGHGLTGAIRGKWKDTKTGKVLRPDFVILDDPQTRESAESPTQCAQRERIITGDVLGLAGPKRKIAAVMPCTIIRKGDLSWRFLSHDIHPEWQGEVSGTVEEWPAAQDTLWKEYAEIWKEGVSQGEGIGAATLFYRKHRKAMDAGAVVSWKHRVRDGELSALQTAENLLLETGVQFWAEYQNAPQDMASSHYELTAEKVMVNQLDLPRLYLPTGANVLTGHCDINRSGLHWCVAGFDQAMTAHVPDYGNYLPPGKSSLWPDNSNQQVIEQAIYQALMRFFTELEMKVFLRENTKVLPGLFLIDASYNSATVHRFCDVHRSTFRILPAIGRAAHRYRWDKRSLVGRPMEECHIQRPQNQANPYVMANVDYWREVMQRAWLGAPGEAGGCTLFRMDSAQRHAAFAEHITAEKLTGKYQNDAGQTRWEWSLAPGVPNDWADALTGCWYAAALMGLSASGTPHTVGRRRKTYKQSDFNRTRR